jgi:lysozyme-like protein
MAAPTQTAPAPAANGNLSYSQLKGVWLTAAQGTQYATNAWASLMAAIAEAESSGNPTATNPYDNDGTQTSWGLWQISLGNHEAPSPDWANPYENAQLAIGKLNTQGLDAWGTYTSGAYQAFLSDKTSADLTAVTGPDAATEGALTAGSEAQVNCAWGLSLGSIDPSIGGYHPVGNISFGQVCILSNSQARAMIGTGLAVAGAVVLGLGVAVLAITVGLPKVAAVAGPLAGLVPGGGAAAAAAAVPSSSGARAGTVADASGTSPEFRAAFLGG